MLLYIFINHWLGLSLSPIVGTTMAPRPLKGCRFYWDYIQDEVLQLSGEEMESILREEKVKGRKGFVEANEKLLPVAGATVTRGCRCQTFGKRHSKLFRSGMQGHR